MLSCPVCGGRLILKRTEVSHGGGQTYDLTAYQCATEDVWVTVEIPKTE